jgi:hypothetical protein
VQLGCKWVQKKSAFILCLLEFHFRFSNVIQSVNL